MSDQYGWRTLGSREIYRNKWISVREDSIVYPNGQPGIYGVVGKDPGVAVIALNTRGEVYLIRQYRHTVGRPMWELPAGGIAPDGNEQAAVHKELHEEMGIRAGRLERLGNFHTALGHETAEIIVYLATELDESGVSTRHQEHDETILDILPVPIPELRRMIRENRLNCGIALASLNLLFQRPGA